METKKVRTEEQTLYFIGWLLLGIAAAAFAIYWMFLRGNTPVIPCIFHLLTGFYCPGCGGTRSLLALLRGEVLRSFLLHPFVPYAVAVGGWFMVSQTIQRLSGGRLRIGMKWRNGWAWGALALVAIHFLGKNVLLLFGIDLIKILS